MNPVFFSELPVNETSATNKYIREIFKIAGIDKHFTFHGCRHTFAITSLLLGIKIEVVSDILGHSEITTTQRYARVVDRLRDKEMDKWDDFEPTIEISTKEKINKLIPQLNQTNSIKVLNYITEMTDSTN